MKAIFFGSPQFAVPTLEALHDVAEIALVVTQPDRPAGRGLRTRPPAVKQRARELGLPIQQPRKVRTREFAESLRALEADVGVVIAYGRILPPAVLEAPRRGCVNLHASLLPAWRGAAPVVWSIVAGDRETGVSFMQMDEGMDTGPVLSMDRVPVESDETAGELAVRLSMLSAEMLSRDLESFVEGRLDAVDQDHERATMAPILTKEHGRIDWGRSAEEVHNHIRGMTPWPGAFTYFGGQRVKALRASVASFEPSPRPAGEVLALPGEGLVVACGSGAIALLELQREGRKRVQAAAFCAGTDIQVGSRWGEAP